MKTTKKKDFHVAHSHPPEMQGASALALFIKALGYGENTPKMRSSPSRRHSNNLSGTYSLGAEMAQGLWPQAVLKKYISKLEQ